MKQIPQGKTIATSTGISNNNNDIGVNKKMTIMIKEKILIFLISMQLRKLDQ